VTSIFGLPAHPLFAHVPVVLVPLAAIGAVLMCWPKLRARIGWWVIGILVVAGIATQFAVSSGQNLKEYVTETSLVRDHTRMGENLRPWLLLMFLCLLGVLIIDRVVQKRASAASGDTTAGDSRGAGRDVMRIASTGLLALALVFSAMSVYWVYEIGHSGSKSVWQKTQVKIDKGQPANEVGGEHDGGSGG
jgi:hypothetical protein